MTETTTAVLFDVGRVLIHPQNEPFRRAAREVSQMELDDDVIEIALARTVWAGALSDDPVEFWSGDEKSASWGGFVGMSAADASRVWAAVSESDTDATPLWSIVEPQAPKVLMDLRRRGIMTAAVSNGDGELRRDLARHGLLGQFDVVLDSHIESLAKPDPTIFLRAAELLDLPIGRCTFVGDDPHFDYAASMSAGVGAACLIDHRVVRPSTWNGVVAHSLRSALDKLASLHASSAGAAS